MKLRWPWSKKHRPEGNGHVAREAKAAAERAREQQQRMWPQVIEARDELARMAERAMRGHT